MNLVIYVRFIIHEMTCHDLKIAVVSKHVKFRGRSDVQMAETRFVMIDQK